MISMNNLFTFVLLLNIGINLLRCTYFYKYLLYNLVQIIVFTQLIVYYYILCFTFIPNFAQR